jgi:uncharacterized protein YqgC (DUF456 family)
VEIAQSLYLILMIVTMIGALLASIIPFIPGPPLLWALAMLYALTTNSVPAAALVVMTLLMVAGASSDYWLPLIGVRTQGLSCLGAVGSIGGGIAGTLLIPIPILGTIAGSVAGAIAVEFTRIRELRRALQAGRTALQLYLWSTAVQFGISLSILLVFVAAQLSAA